MKLMTTGGPDTGTIVTPNYGLIFASQDLLAADLMAGAFLNANRSSSDDIYCHDAVQSYIERNGKFIEPLIVTGASRTGTTLLQRLLSEDPNTRSPYTFEMELPIPPMKTGTNPLEDPRIGLRW